MLPVEWYRACEKNVISDGFWRRYPSRTEAEDAAARAFAKLPVARRAELLAGRGAKPKAAKRKPKPATRTKSKTAPKPKGVKRAKKPKPKGKKT
jgi:hypothetical protein